MKTIIVLILMLLALYSAVCQNPTTAPPPVEQKAIEDNSFLIEEAYNQEYNVIQHISSFTRDLRSNDWVYTFTQEWPFPGHEKHQLSYTLVGAHSSDFPGSGAGFGDVALNYRYQLHDGKTLGFAPRLTLIAPTGSAAKGRGLGGYGFQTNLPFSVRVNPKLVTHWNAGATFVPHAQNEFGDKAFVTGYNLGQSFIWLAKPRFNGMLETLWSGAESVVAQDSTQRNHSLLVSPGIRWAHNFDNGLQIVPGIAVPLGVGPSQGDRGLILYLSFEHPIGTTEKQ